MEIKNEFIPYEQALALKELGFNEPCLGNYRLPTNRLITEWEMQNTPEHTLGIPAPLYQQAFRWFREKYGYYYPIHRITNNTNQVLYSIGPYAGDYFTYEEAELACLIKLIEIVKNK